MQSNNVVKHQPGSACKLLRDTSPGAAPQQNTLPLVGRSRWRIPRYPTGGSSLGSVNAWVTHAPFFIPISPALGMNKISPAQAINFETYVPIKINLKKLWEDQASFTISLVTLMSFATQTQNKKKTFW